MKILIVDDEENIRYTFREFLVREGYEVSTAEDVPSALKALGREPFDLAFVDILMGSRSGIEILQEVKKAGLRCPVVMITGQPDLDNTTASVRLGAFDFLVKPVLKETLLMTARIALKHKSLMDENEAIARERENYRRNLEAIFRSVQDGVLSVDDRMRILMANDSVRLVCGIEPDAAIGKTLSEIAGTCQGACAHVLEETLKGGKPVREYRVECGDARHPDRVVVLSSAPLIGPDGGSLGGVLVIRDITRLSGLERELRERYRFHNLIGKSHRMQEIYRLCENLAGNETTVLITGESGTGKELVAEALHYAGRRALKPIVKVNCSALSENLLESELFGHVKGAFTGALQNKTGRFQMADGGTLFLDEIGDISPSIQLKLLRVLQEKELERVGDSHTVKVDVRVITATNSDLREKVRRHEFREDLYYRLKVVEIRLPPLRERREDIPLLIGHFCDEYNRKFHKNIEGVSQEVMEWMMQNSWPGNVRELKHCLEHAFVLSNGRIILREHLPPEFTTEASMHATSMQAPEAPPGPGEGPESIRTALEKTGWNKAKAARQLGISRQTLYRKIEDYKIKEEKIIE
jgi:two-component system, NtrC family, response regulator HydG